ncbi:hypothetical protein SteCoe_3140 [Stentor coeruleus]|uniref:Uncharacterized protein n=1 Tax=Stentor coeruleus TaxID=5963 RepID=A0A1R2CXT2_9CILI|nr:hypothetical protein SteCoe_3140 [Stentor coeruleus]
MMNAELYLSAQDVAHWMLMSETNPRLKYFESRISEKISIFDISVKCKNFDLDKIYESNPQVKNNIKRGNSMLVTFKVPRSSLDSPMPNPLDEVNPHEEHKGKKSKKEKDQGQDQDQDQDQNQKEKTEKECKTSIFKNIETVQWVRRGLTKFFDLSLNFLIESNSIDRDGTFKNHGNRENHKNSNETIRSSIFYYVENALIKGKTIEVYQTEKANGENLQVGFIKEINKWIISSKNCSLVAENEEEVRRHKDDRYNFAKLIAVEWFKYLKNCSNVEELKRDIDGKSLIGEYIGNEDFMHIVKYNEIALKFYAIVDNNSCFPCIPTIESFYFFHKYNIQTVNITKIGSFQKISTLYSTLKTLFIQISEQDLAQGGEGTVLYFVSNSFPDFSLFQETESNILSKNLTLDIENIVKIISENQQSISLCKIKTLEYRIFRKIREKLKNMTNDETKNNKIKAKFESELNSLIKGFNLPKKYETYTAFYDLNADKVSKKLQNGEKKTKKGALSGNMSNILHSPQNVPIIIDASPSIKYNWKELANGLEYILCNTKKTDILKPNNLYNEVRMESNDYESQVALYVLLGYDEEMEDIEANKSNGYTKKSCPPVFLNCFSKKKLREGLEKEVRKHYENKRKMFENLRVSERSCKITVLGRDIQELCEMLNKKVIEMGEIDSFLQSPETIIIKKHKIFIIFPICFPGVGKTHLARYINQFKKTMPKLAYKCIDSDNMREKVMKSLKIKNIYEKFKASSKKTNEDVKANLLSTIEKSNQKSLIFIDKNFPPKHLAKYTRDIDYLKNDYEIIKIGLYPDSKPWAVSKVKKYEFSYNLLVTSLNRVLKRKKHPVLEGDNSHKIAVVISMFNAYANYEIDKENRVDEIIRVKFANEDEDLEDLGIKGRLTELLSKLNIKDDAERCNYEDIAAVLKDKEIEEIDLEAQIMSELERVISKY